jgi:hypothetical protein
MPTQDLPSAIRLLPVPDFWPPLDADQALHTHPERSAGPLESGHRHAQPPVADPGPPWPRQFAVLLAEGLAGVRPVRQVLPWMSEQGSVHLHRLLPLFACGHRPRLQRVITAQPAKGVIEMTMIVAFGHRTRALAVRLEQTGQAQPTGQAQTGQAQPTGQAQRPRWRCTAIEAG